MQLVAYGAQDIYLTGNPQITFFKVVYRRHTNFAMESIEQTFNGAVAFGTRVTATISRNGDLIKDMWLEVSVSATTGGKYGVGNVLVKQVEVEIGGQLIDRQYGEWMDIWSELSVPEGKRVGYDTMVGNDTPADQSRKLDVPLMFWFNRNPGLALPLIALQYHEVKINLDIASKADCFGSATEPTLSLKLWVDYIYLDTDERRRFAQVSHEYLIEQLQFTGDASISGSSFRTELNFNHPCKELIWVYQTAAQARGAGNGSKPCQFTTLEDDAVETGPRAILKLNGQDRFQERRMEYFRRVQGFKHHTHSVRTTEVYTTETPYNQYIYLYSFALNPEEHQPSGTCNFSRIDNTVLSFNGLSTLDSGSGAAAGIVKVFAVNYNVLRIMSGMGGLAYSN